MERAREKNERGHKQRKGHQGGRGGKRGRRTGFKFTRLVVWDDKIFLFIYCYYIL